MASVMKLKDNHSGTRFKSYFFKVSGMREFSETIRCIISLVLLSFLLSGNAFAQNGFTTHKVEKQETIFGIAKKYNVTIEQILDANPVMKEKDFMLKKGFVVNIPKTVSKSEQKAIQKSNINLGVLLPLHDINGDGRRMMEYYRGMLMAVADMKKEGYNITLTAWNAAEDADIRPFLATPEASRCDVFFGPLYTKQVRDIADFCMTKDIRLVIPFSISGNDVLTCPQIYQVYQEPADITAKSIEQFPAIFPKAHTVFVDCNDEQSKKGAFTLGLRKHLEEKGMTYNITNVNTPIESFAKAFASNKSNVVVLNSGRSPQLGAVLAKLDELLTVTKDVKVSMYGYNEWLMYTEVYGAKMRKYDTYIPSVYDYDDHSLSVRAFRERYRKLFGGDMLYALPSFALTGYDHTMFFVRGIVKYGKSFSGAASQTCLQPMQTPLDFKRVKNGGYENKAFLLIHYK